MLQYRRAAWTLDCWQQVILQYHSVSLIRQSLPLRLKSHSCSVRSTARYGSSMGLPQTRMRALSQSLGMSLLQRVFARDAHAHACLCRCMTLSMSARVALPLCWFVRRPQKVSQKREHRARLLEHTKLVCFHSPGLEEQSRRVAKVFEAVVCGTDSHSAAAVRSDI